MTLQLYKIWSDGEALEQSYLNKLAGLAWTDTSGLLYQRLLLAQVILSFLWVSLSMMQTRPEDKARKSCIRPATAPTMALLYLIQY